MVAQNVSVNKYQQAIVSCLWEEPQCFDTLMDTIRHCGTWNREDLQGLSGVIENELTLFSAMSWIGFKRGLYFLTALGRRLVSGSS